MVNSKNIMRITNSVDTRKRARDIEEIGKLFPIDKSINYKITPNINVEHNTNRVRDEFMFKPRMRWFTEGSEFLKMETSMENLVLQNREEKKEDGIEERENKRRRTSGGYNTNKNGLTYEKMTDIKDILTVIQETDCSTMVKLCGSEKIFVRTKKNGLFKYMKKHIDEAVEKAHGCKNPDECYIDDVCKNIFIIEKKFQRCSGSVCEKIQTPDFKIWQYSRTFPGYNIVYIYCLSDWFKNNCKAEIEYLNYKKIPFFWGDSETYKYDIIKFIINYR